MNFGGTARLFYEIKMAYFPSTYFFLRFYSQTLDSGCEIKIMFSLFD